MTSRSFLPIGALAAYDAIGYSVVPPILPALQVRAGATALEASLIFAGFSLGMIAGFIAAGLVIARRGPRAAAISGAMLHLTADLLFVFGHSVGIYSTARVVQGLGAGFVWMAAVFAVLQIWPERPEPWLGRILTAFAVGSVVGPLEAALGGPVRPFIADATLAVVGLTAAAAFPRGRGRPFGWDLRMLRSRQLGFAVLMVTLVALVISVLDGSYTLHFSTQLSQTGLALLFTASVAAYGVGALLPLASGSLPIAKATAQVGAVLSAMMLVGIAAFDTVAAWFVLVVLLGAALGATEASVLSIASNVSERSLITSMVVYSQGFAVGFLIGPPLATWLTTQASLVASAVVVGAVLVAGAATGFLVPSSPEVPAGGHHLE
jgi:MFS family permease